MVAPYCPGVPFDWNYYFPGGNYGGLISVGDHVAGTITLSGFVALTCTANTTNDSGATCSVSPDGSVISFDLPSVQGLDPGDIYGTAEIASGAPNCGTISATLHLTEPHTFTGTETDPYECNGVECSIPTLGTPGLAALALLLAGLAVVVLLRRWRA